MNKSYYVSQGKTIVCDQKGDKRERKNIKDIKKFLTIENTLESMNEYYDFTKLEIELNNDNKANVINIALGLCTFITLGYFATRKMDLSVVNELNFLEASLIPLTISSIGLYTVDGLKKEETKLKNKLILVKKELVKLQNEWFDLNNSETITLEHDAMPKYILDDEAFELISNIENTVLENNKAKSLVFKKNNI